MITNGDGVADAVNEVIAVQNFDADGNVVYEAYDDNLDGSIDRVYTYEYDADEILVTAYQGYDWDSDGTLDYIAYTYTYEYDADGNRTSATSQEPWSDNIYLYDYEYDDDGNLVSIRQYVDSDGDGNS